VRAGDRQRREDVNRHLTRAPFSVSKIRYFSRKGSVVYKKTMLKGPLCGAIEGAGAKAAVSLPMASASIKPK